MTSSAKTVYLDALRDAVIDPDRISYDNEYDDLVYTIAGTALDTGVEKAGLDRLTRMLVARCLAASEDNLTMLAKRTPWHTNTQAGIAYLDRPVAAGYTLSDAEAAGNAELAVTGGEDEPVADTDSDA